MHEEYWGRGYATEIGRAGLTVAFDTLRADHVVSFTEIHNLRSRVVMERIGMTYARDFCHPGLIEGSYADPLPPPAPALLGFDADRDSIDIRIVRLGLIVCTHDCGNGHTSGAELREHPRPS